MREMLNACYRQRCIWYDYRENRWLYDLERLFEQFKGEHGYDVLDNDFITRRLSELPLASRWILAWAALLGNSFSFDLVCQFMSGEFGYVDDCPDRKDAQKRTTFSKRQAVAGLQAAVSACIIVQGETDDRFRFAHDRYVQAAAVRSPGTSLFLSCLLALHTKALLSCLILADNGNSTVSGGMQCQEYALHHRANSHETNRLRY